jgi:hypothetical protein
MQLGIMTLIAGTFALSVAGLLFMHLGLIRKNVTTTGIHHHLQSSVIVPQQFVQRAFGNQTLFDPVAVAMIWGMRGPTWSWYVEVKPCCGFYPFQQRELESGRLKRCSCNSIA